MWLVLLWYAFYWGGLKPNLHNSGVRLYCSMVVLMYLYFAVVISWYLITWPSCSLFCLPVSLSLSIESVKMGMLIYSSGLLSMSLWYLYGAFTCWFFCCCFFFFSPALTASTTPCLTSLNLGLFISNLREINCASSFSLGCCKNIIIWSVCDKTVLTYTHSVMIFMLTCEIKSKKQQSNSSYFAWNFDSNILSVIFHNDFTNREARAHTLCVGAKIFLISRHPRLTCHFL